MSTKSKTGYFGPTHYDGMTAAGADFDLRNRSGQPPTIAERLYVVNVGDTIAELVVSKIPDGLPGAADISIPIPAMVAATGDGQPVVIDLPVAKIDSTTTVGLRITAFWWHNGVDKLNP